MEVPRSRCTPPHKTLVFVGVWNSGWSVEKAVFVLVLIQVQMQMHTRLCNGILVFSRHSGRPYTLPFHAHPRLLGGVEERRRPLEKAARGTENVSLAPICHQTVQILQRNEASRARRARALAAVALRPSN
jgi:hypothetical protein